MFLVLVGGDERMSSQRVPQVVRAIEWVPGRSSGSLDGPVRDPVRDIRDLQDLPEGSKVRSVRVPARPVAVGRIRRLVLQTPNLGSTRCGID